MWKGVGEFSSRLLQLGVKVGNNGGGGLETQQKLSGFPCTFKHTEMLLGRSAPSKGGGALFVIHPFLVALNNHTDKDRRAFVGHRGHREHT